MSKLIKTISLGALTTVIGTQTGFAQENMFARDRIVGAGERYYPEFEPREIRSGSFIFSPQLGLNVSSNSNVFAVEDDEESDIVARVTPEFKLRSDWGVHAIGFSGSVDHNEYIDRGDESHTAFGVGANGRLDVTRDFDISADAGFRQAFETRGSTGDVANILEPNQYDTTFANVNFNWQRDVVRFTLGAGLTDVVYDDLVFSAAALEAGADPDRSYRDNQQLELRGRADYAVSPDVAIFLAASMSERDYDQEVNLLDDSFYNDVNRDADGYRVEVGTNFQLTQLLRGEFALGYLEEDRDDPTFGKVDGFLAKADVQWLPTELTKLSLTVNRNVRDTGLIDVPSALVTNTRLSIDHELLRNVYLNGFAGLYVEEHDGELTSYDQEYTFLGAGVVYKMNPNAHWDFGVQFTDADADRDASGRQRGRIYDQTVVGVGLKLFP